MTQVDDSGRKDFFISYTGVDLKWAEWVAWQLEQASFTTVIQAWDFRPGNNFAIKMDEASKLAERTIVILTPNFLKSGFTAAEWTTAFAQDPTGEKRLVVPVLVEKTDVSGLLGQIIYIDLTNKTGDDALTALLAGIQPGRSKPTDAPDFPGQKVEASIIQAPVTRATELVWKAEQYAPTVTWRTEPRGSGGSTVLEIQLVPMSTALIPVATLSKLADALANTGRQGGLFSPSVGIGTDSDADHVQVFSLRERDVNDSGLLVTRGGGRGAWIELPSDMLGSVFDAKELSPRISAVLRLLMSLDVPAAERYAVAARLGSISMLSVGDARIVGNRNSASMSSLGQTDIEIPIEDSVNADAIAASADEIAAEIVARLAVRLK